MNFKLFIRQAGDQFNQVTVPFSTYRTAVETGKRIAGSGNFFIEGPPDFVPSSDEQLLIQTQTESRASRRKQLLESL